MGGRRVYNGFGPAAIVRFAGRFRLGLEILGLLVLARVAPGIGVAAGGVLPLKHVAIVTIFVLTGLTVGTAQLGREIRNWPLHLGVQLTTFVVYPLVFAVVHVPFDGVADGQITLGLYLLAALPTTISSCVVLTSLAGGNREGALFNAVGGNLAGIVLSPLVFLFLIRAGDVTLEFDRASVALRIAGLVLLPFAVGHVLRLWLAGITDRHRALLRRVNTGAILLIVYLALCGAFGRDTGSVSLTVLGALAGGGALIYGAMASLLWVLGGVLPFAREDRIALLFAGSQKTLAFGLPLVLAFCEQVPGISPEIVALPMIVFHPVELLIASFMVDALRHSEPPYGAEKSGAPV